MAPSTPIDWAKYTLDTKAVAKLTGYNIQWLRTLARDGRIPAKRRGRDWRFCIEEINEHFEIQTKAAVNEETSSAT